MHEWSLIGFTLLAQLAAGAFFLESFYKVINPDSFYREKVISLKPVLVAVSLAALIISFLHLGNPANAANALNNIGSSWLSREILFVSLFTSGLGIAMVVDFSAKKNSGLNKAISILTSLAGLAAVFSMAKVYMLPTVPVWNSLFTMLQFYLSTFLLGSAMILFWSTKETRHRIYKFLLILVTLSIITWISSTLLLDQSNLAAAKSLQVIISENSFLYYGRIVLLALSVLLVLLSLQKDTRLTANGYSLNIFLLLFLAEIAGRYLFYASYVRIGV